MNFLRMKFSLVTKTFPKSNEWNFPWNLTPDSKIHVED